MLSLVGNPVAVNPDSALKRIARERGWQVRDFRTGRKAARIGVPTAAGMGAVAGAIFKRFGSVTAVLAADVSALAEVSGIGDSVARSIHEAVGDQGGAIRSPSSVVGGTG